MNIIKLAIIKSIAEATTTGENALEKAINGVIGDGIQLFSGIAASVAGLAFTICGIGIMIGSDWGQASKKHLPKIVIGFLIAVLALVIVSYLKTQAGSYN